MKSASRVSLFLAIAVAWLVPLQHASAQALTVPADALRESASQSLQSLFYLVGKSVSDVDLGAALKGMDSPDLPGMQGIAAGFEVQLKLRQVTRGTLLSAVPAIVRLRSPDGYVLLAAAGSGGVLVYSGGSAGVMSSSLLQQRLGDNVTDALVLEKPAMYRIEDAVRVVQPLVSGRAHEENVEVSNLDKNPLAFQVESTSCGCTTANRDMQTLAPGQRQTVKFVISETTQAERLVVATLHTSDPSSPRALVGLLIVPPLVQASPDSLSIHGDVGHSITESVSVTAPKELRLQKVSIGNPLITARIISQEMAGEKEIYRISVTVSPKLPAGAFSDEIMLGFNDAKAELDVPIEGYADGDIKASPSLVVVDGSASSRLSRTVIVYSPIDQAFAITAVHSDNPTVIARTTLNKSSVRHSVVFKIENKTWQALQSHVTLLLSDGRVLTIDVLGQSK